ncbi:SitA5 family polymorphic toxin [Archangium lipolyticum]
MSRHSVDTRPVETRRSPRAGALALAALMLVTACATGAPMGGGLTASRYRPPVPHDSPEPWALEAEAEDGSQEGEAFFARLPTDFPPVQVSDAEFSAAMTTLWLDMPLRVAASRPPLYVGRRLASAFAPSSGEAGQSDLARAYGHFCERCGTPGDCLTLFEDGPRIQDDDKRSLALALAVGPALEGVSSEVRAMLDPTRMLAMLSISITVYMALLLAPVPEPITKGAALVFSAALWGYLGYEFFDLLRAYAQLYEDAPRASTFAELREIGERFGRVIGPNSVRILVIVGTAAIGETAALASKAPKLPGFAQASERVAASAGLGLLETATGAERLIVSVPEGTIRMVMAPHAVAMAARGVGAGSPAPTRGKLLPNGHRAWGSFNGFKSAMGPAGKGKEWHHLVEQTKGNVKRFGGEAIHNTENVVALDKPLHDEVSAFYSSIQWTATRSSRLTVRQWLSTQSYEAQREFALLAIENIKNGVW